MQQTSKESSWGDSLNEDAIQGGSQGGTPDPDCKPLEDKRYEQDTQNPQMQQTSKESSWGDNLNEDAIQGGSQGVPPIPIVKPLEDKRYEQDTQNPQMQQISKERSWEDSLNEDAIQGGSQGGPPDPDRKPLENDRYKQDTKWRDRLARWVVIVTSIWMLIILFILVIKGFCSTFDLEKEVLITLLATTTANVLGLPLIVLRGIFSEGKHPTKEHPSRPA